MPNMGMKYSFDARFEFARRLSATFQRSASNCSMPVRWSAIIRYRSFLGSCLFLWHWCSPAPSAGPRQARPGRRCRVRVRDVDRGRRAAESSSGFRKAGRRGTTRCRQRVFPARPCVPKETDRALSGWRPLGLVFRGKWYMLFTVTIPLLYRRYLWIPREIVSNEQSHRNHIIH